MSRKKLWPAAVLVGLCSLCFHAAGNFVAIGARLDASTTQSRVPRIDGFSPSVIVEGAANTKLDVIGTDLDLLPKISILDENGNWQELAISPVSATRAEVMVPSEYFRTPRFVLFAPESNMDSALSVLVYSKALASTPVQPGFKIEVMPEDVGTGGTITITGTGFRAGMRVALGLGKTVGVLTETQLVDETFMTAEMPGLIPARDLFVSLIGVDGKTRSEPAAVMSTVQERESDATQHQRAGLSASEWNQNGLKLMASGNFALAADKFVEAARSDMSAFASAPIVNPASAVFANNAGYAFFKVGKYVESVFWLERACEIDPKRAVAYLNLGDAWAKMNRVPEARRSYEKYLELAPNSKMAAEVRGKLGGLAGLR
jgi:TPR repeat